MSPSTSLKSEYAFAGKMFGDVRRADRMVSMLGAMARHPCGTVSETFSCPAEQQGAYDWVENDRFGSDVVQKVMSVATARNCNGMPVVFCILDGSSIALTDATGEKDFGSIGTRTSGARGLKVLNAIGLDSQGQTLGVLGQDWWTREDEPARKGYRSLKSRESYRWVELAETVHATLAEHAPGTKMHVLGDRETDASEFIRRLGELDCDFTLRSNGTRHVQVEGKFVPMMPLLRQQTPLASMTVVVPRKGNRPERTATVMLRALRIEVRLRDKHTQRKKVVPLTVVWAYEPRPPRGIERLNWLLYTTDLLDAQTVVSAVSHYTRRWRIEEFHKALKSGGGCVEDSQLRSASGVIKWATLHSIVAARSIRLRDLATHSPDAPATMALSGEEIQALVVLKKLEKRRTETISAEGLTIGRAVRWIGDLGGFAATGVSKKLPGPTVISRGLERVQELAAVLRSGLVTEKIR